jgi:hypothetical protein
MRRLQIVFAIVLLVAAHSLAHAQGGIAIKAGLSYGTSSNAGVAPGTTQRSGFAVGIGASTSGVIGFGIEGLYAQRGYSSTSPLDSRHLDYIDVPVTLRLSLANAVVSPFAYLGPQLSYELNCGTDSGSCPASGNDKITYAGVIGAGLRFASLGGLSAEARYVYGLSDLKLSTVQSSSSYQTRSLLLLLGIGF